ncbi:hypothetical protein [Proteiniphilum sp. X52]|uniref:hypothetical protein n=1 Tax=Proteiniphilum sp. X52 TaxID=2382159 RepID=UPI000F0A91F5|nr:hypothetical protein [Proteiniphilum sp. X52]RNC66196.1 hypothetical protein D7D25_04530 [Proteiniphilum sp. X52]
MKIMKTLLIIPLLLHLIGMVGCEDDKNDTYPEATIVKELPRMGMGNNTKSLVIRSQKELEALFDKSELDRVEELRQIDFSRYTLLTGYVVSSTNVSIVEHSFSKTGATTYSYLLKIIRGDATIPGSHRYGIIVPKLPKSADIEFEIEEVMLEN